MRQEGEAGRTEKPRQASDLRPIRLDVFSLTTVVFDDPIQGCVPPPDGELALGSARVGILEVDVLDTLDHLGCEGSREARPIPFGLLREKEAEHLGVQSLCIFGKSVDHGYTQNARILRITKPGAPYGP